MSQQVAFNCPNCSSELITFKTTEYEAESIGKLLLSLLVCERCGYRHSDLIPLASHQPVAFTAKIDTLEDLNMHVIKSNTATVVLPEFHATITPGPESDAYITNIEGILRRFAGVLTLMMASCQGRKKVKAEGVSGKIERAILGKERFTLVIKDPMGNSAIIASKPGKVRKRRLSKRELTNLKLSRYALSDKSN